MHRAQCAQEVSAMDAKVLMEFQQNLILGDGFMAILQLQIGMSKDLPVLVQGLETHKRGASQGVLRLR
jgi:hypothetical protein